MKRDRADRAERSPESLAGIVERVTFHNPDSGFCVLRLKVRGHRDLVALVGHVASVAPGELVQASGEWQNTVEHGMQFRAAHLEVTPPSSLEGIERYLGSGLIRGIGKELAKRLVGAFGESVFDVIETHPERLRTVDGIGTVRVRRIVEGWDEQKAIREIMVFLQSHGVGTARAVRIYKTYGADAIPLICENPYRLARDIRGIGFKTADALASRLGIEKTAMVRARAGISYVLLEALGDGHCALPRGQLLRTAEELLEIPCQTLEEALAQELGEERLVADTIDHEDAVFLAHLWQAERVVAERLRSLGGSRPPWPAVDQELALPWVENRLDVELSRSQRDAVRLALESRGLVITGGPGVGKTTLVRAILDILRAKGVRVSLGAPTGRAAKRLAESTGLEAKTIHRLLEVDPRSGGFRRNEQHPLECDLLVLDEVSMVDVPLMAAVALALPEAGALLLVGDVDQLPSVGPGQVLRDVIDSGVLPVARLREIFRQAQESRIVTNAHLVNDGRMPALEAPAGEETSDFYFVEAADPEDGQRKVVEIVRGRIPKRFGLDPVRQVQVLCPMNRGPLGARTLNLELQRALNPPRPGEPSVERFGWTFRLRDKVMQVENDYDKEVFNGDLGVVSAIEPDAQEITIDFDGRPVTYRFGELDQVVLAYATTIHKAQGSEYPAVVLTLAMQHYMMLRRNLVYTGITRARRLVVIVGEKRALGLAVGGRPEERRFSKLREWLTGV